MADDTSNDTVDDFDDDDKPIDDKPATPGAGTTTTKPAEDELAQMRVALKKANGEARTHRLEAEKLRNAQLSDNERAIADARAEARSEALLEAGTRMVDAEFRAAAAGRDFDVKALLDGLDRKRFLEDDGTPNTDRITKYVDKIAPPKGDRVPPGRGGPRSTSDRPNDMNALIRRRAGATSE